MLRWLTSCLGWYLAPLNPTMAARRGREASPALRLGTAKHINFCSALIGRTGTLFRIWRCGSLVVKVSLRVAVLLSSVWRCAEIIKKFKNLTISNTFRMV